MARLNVNPDGIYSDQWATTV